MDIYNHKSSVSVICIENSPTVVDHFPMAKWKQTVIAGGIMLAIAIVSAGTVFGVSAAIASAAKLVTIAIGAGIGGLVEQLIHISIRMITRIIVNSHLG